jgi:hypothetical protein
MTRQRFAVVILGLVAFLTMVMINILQLGNREFIAATNNLVLLGFGVLATGQALLYWRLSPNREEATRVWLLFGLGMLCYSLAQLVWMAYNWAGNEVPYPSLGDLFWVIAYPLLFVSLLNKILLLGVLPSRRQVTFVITLGGILFLIISYVILLPMLTYAATARAIETALNIFYPLMDFVLLLAVSFLITVLWKGRLSRSWNILAAGFFFLAVADVFFIFATWNGLYYAESARVNLLTRTIDVLYNLATFLLALGVYLHQWVATSQLESMEFEFAKTILGEQSKPQPRTFTPEMQILLDKTFFMVDREQNVYFFSQYYRKLCQLLGKNSEYAVGTPLHALLGLEQQFVKDIFAGVQYGQTSVTSVEILISATRIPAILKVNPARNGSDVFLKFWHEGKPIGMENHKSIDGMLVDEYLQSVQGLEGANPDVRGATAFFLIEVQEIYLFLVHMGGYRIGQVLADKFNKMAASQRAGVTITDGRIILSSALEGEVMASLLQLTLKTVQELTSTEATSKVLKQLNKKMPEGIIRSAQNIGLAL